MTVLNPIRFNGEKRMDTHPLQSTEYTSQHAAEANHHFDEAVRRFLRQWIEQGTGSHTDTDDIHSQYAAHDLEAFVEGGALRAFFKHHDDALEQLLGQPDIAQHLLRSGYEVHFEPDAYEPLLSRFERRIYNLAAHREHREVPFRYSPTSRQGVHGDSIGWTDTVQEGDNAPREDIGYYFGTRRSDETALGILARQLHNEAQVAYDLPMHVMTDGYMEDALRAIRATTEQLGEAGETALHGFVIQRRHAAHDRHLGAAFLLMNPAQPDQPRRVMFCDTLNPSGTPPWWNTFKRVLDAVFPQPEGTALVSDRLEDGSVNLQRLHDGVPVRHQDIDCAFYTASIAKALIQLAAQQPDLLLYGPIEHVVSRMTERMPDYFLEANVPKLPTVVRETNIIRRWNTGREALLEYVK
ncbi:hypothetical protein ACAW74_07820 [Fibrella sp. WM1]|uniref:hypothetical protein n=1 Tax=Fibrella musci TaxID=3242485 RepID=UPI003522F625